MRNLYRYPEMFQLNEKQILVLFSKIPFLNGGLFECLDKFKKIDILQDSDMYIDGFSRNDTKDSAGNYKYRPLLIQQQCTEIDKMVYELYKLTEEEIDFIEK